MAEQFLPQKPRSKLFSICGRPSSKLTLVIDQYEGPINQIYVASEIYLRTKINPSVERLKISKTSLDKNFLVTMDEGQKIIDVFDGIKLKWKYVCVKLDNEKFPKRHFELSFDEKYKEVVLGSYFPYVQKISKSIKEENKSMKIHSLGSLSPGNRVIWKTINFDHPATFETLAMDPELKKALIDDLNRFVKRKDIFRRVGKAWKRGYLLYGPPGTGKSSLIAAMANYLKFDIYDMELSQLTHRNSNFDLRELLAFTTNRSILVIEDIDTNKSSMERGDSKLTLSGLLDSMDGIWSSCLDERIIVVTTNQKDRLGPAFLRPGRIDMHIHMSYCTPCGFKLLASNYLKIQNHDLFEEIEELIKEVNITPAQVAEELMKNDNAEMALKGLIKFIRGKKKPIIQGKKKMDDLEFDSGSDFEDSD